MEQDKIKQHQAEIVRTLAPYLMAFPQSKINTGSLLVYARALSPLSIAEVDAAMLKLMRTSKFFPTVAEIFEQAESVRETACGQETASVDEAWHDVMKQVHDAFVYREPAFSSDEIKRAALNMGWTALCNLEPDGMNTARAQFRDIYLGILRRKKDQQHNKAVLEQLPPARVQALVGKVAQKLEVIAGGREGTAV